MRHIEPWGNWKKTFNLVFVLLFQYVGMHAQTFVPVAPEALSSTFVRCIYKDSKGYLWFGTGTGLIRYDGTNVYRYEHRLGDRTTITDNRINAIVEDHQRNLWIGTGQGLVIYNRDKDNFYDADSIVGNKNHLDNKYVSALCIGPDDRIWIGTHGQGLKVYDKKKLTFTYLHENTSPTNISSVNYITSLYLMGNAVWAGTKGGLKIFDSRDMRPMPIPLNEPTLAAKEITQVKADGVGNIWISTVDREIIKLSSKNGSFTISKTLLKRKTIRGAEGNVLALSVDRKNNLWIAGENSGLNYMESSTGVITSFEAEEGNLEKLPTNSIRSVYVDNTGITWIGTYNKGAYIVDNHAKKFDSYRSNHLTKYGWRGNNVKALAEDRQGNVWIACDGGGLRKLDTRANELKFEDAINKKLATPYLSALLMEDEKTLWVGTWGSGVYRIDLHSGIVVNYKIAANGFGDNKVLCIYQDSRKRIWVGSVGSGLFYFDRKTDIFQALNEEKNADYIRKTAYVMSILEDADNTLWVGTLFGLYKLVFKYDDVYDVAIFVKNSKPGSISSNNIQTIYKDTNRNLWIGTGDNGICIKNYPGSTFKNLPKEPGGVSNIIRGILSDASGNKWFSSNKGLMKYDPTTDLVRDYTKDDGLPSNEFNASACLRASNGKLYFGSDNGLVSFYPDSIRNSTIRPVVYFTDLKLNNQSVKIDAEDSPLKKHISLTSAITLPYSQRSFAIDFVAINYGQTSRNQYCYKLEGFDPDWNCVGSETRATYTNIDPGHYVFLVKASNSDCVWSVAPARIEITINQAFWKTWWAFLLYAAMISAIIYFLMHFRMERMKIKNQLDLERMAHEKEHVLSKSKTEFFTNISHEFRTPLSLIVMPLENLLYDVHVPALIKDRLITIHKSASRMMRLVNEVMDFNKLEEAQLKLDIRQGELVICITDIAATFRETADKRKIHFGVHAMVMPIEGWFDHDKVEKIVMNILSNAFKFTLDGGQINVIINTKDLALGVEQKKMRFLEVTILDNGIGISEDELGHIFDKFFQAKSAHKNANPGTGIGLSLTKGLIELHHGTITAESTPEQGTKFVWMIPIERSAYAEEVIRSTEMNEQGKQSLVKVNFESGREVAVEEQPDKPQILVVEDNDELRKYISMELRYQFIVLEASNGEEGLKMAADKSPDLIISDILMPNKTGIELCHAIKNDIKTSHIPFILLTAKATVEDQIAGIESGADIYITKPFSMRFLVTHVRNIIDSRQKLYAHFSQDVYLLPSKATSNEIDQNFLQRTVDYIIEHIQDTQLSVESLADLFNLSRVQVYRKIKALTGKTAVEFIRMVRLKQALKLMETKKYTLSEIAYQTGFNSASYFTRSFKEEYGKAPSEYLEVGL